MPVAEDEIHVYDRTIPRVGTDAMALAPNAVGSIDRVLGAPDAAA